MERKSGRETSEYQHVKLAQTVGLVVLAVGVGLVLAGALAQSWVIAFSGAALAYVGGELMEKTVSAYAHSRGLAKSLPTSIVNHNSNKPKPVL